MKTEQNIQETEANVLKLIYTTAITKQYASKEECIKRLNEVGTCAQVFKKWKKI